MLTQKASDSYLQYVRWLCSVYFHFLPDQLAKLRNPTLDIRQLKVWQMVFRHHRLVWSTMYQQRNKA